MTLKIIFMGTPEFSVPILKSINESNHELLAVYTQSAKKKSRGQKLTKSPVHQFADKLKIPVRCPEDLDSEYEVNLIKDMQPDIIIVVAYGKILPERLLVLSKIDFLNIHASLLPKWRGAAPIQRAIMNMDDETGISIMKIVKKLDAGPVMKFLKVNIGKETTYESLSKEMSILSAGLIVECLNIIKNKKEKFIPQDNKKATYAKKIDKSEAKINWKNKAKNIIASINALYPNPGSWFKLNGVRIKILKAKEIVAKGNPGEAINDKLLIACAENAIQVLEVKKEGKSNMSASSFLIGNKIKAGTNLNEV
tara:strand:- start:123 stop:1049 length:927 start_codon:yes stop_codon:yes gene_type:complete